MPADLIVTIPMNEENADVFDVKVMVFERPTKISIEGRVDFEDAVFKDPSIQIRIELLVVNNQSDMLLIKS